MRLRRNIKSRIAAAMAAVMVFSMAAPALPVYAGNPGDPAEIVFDPGYGPGLDKTNNGYAALVGGKFTGKQGYPLTDTSSNWSNTGIATMNTTGGGVGTGPRPVLPTYADGTWRGYRMTGWKMADGNTLANLPYGYPYETTTTYTAEWEPLTTATGLTCYVMHYRDLGLGNGGWPDFTPTSTPWNDPAQKDKMHAFDTGSWVTTDVKAKTEVGATYLRTVPGYELYDVLIKNNKSLKYGETPKTDAGTIPVNDSKYPGAEIDGTTHNLKGSMPNDDLMVAYRYKPDPSKTFKLKIEYVTRDDSSGSAVDTLLTGLKVGGATISNPQIVADVPAETAISLPNAKSIQYNEGIYKFERAEIVSGTTDKAAENVYGMKTTRSDNSTPALKADTGELSDVKMPNQDVTIKYVLELNTDAKRTLTVNYRDGNTAVTDPSGNTTYSPMVFPSGTAVEPPTQEMNLGGNKSIKTPHVAGYNTTFAPTFTPATSFSHLASNVADQTYGFSFLASGTINVTYTPDYADRSVWADVTFGVSGNGTMPGSTTKQVKIGTSPTLSSLVGSLTPAPNTYYRFAGWYIGGGSTGNEPTGARLDDPTGAPNPTVTITGDTKLVAKFEENPAEWFDIHFVAGPHGNINGTASILNQHVHAGTTFASLTKPTATADTNYIFLNNGTDNWRDEDDVQMTGPEIIRKSQTFKAVFTSQIPDDNDFAIPNATGTVAANGAGAVKLSAVNNRRHYVLTDKDGNIIAVKTGNELMSGDFSPVELNKEYKVYEVRDSVPTTLTGNMNDGIVNSGDCSQPTSVIVPPVGANVNVGNDAANAGQKTITVSPTAPNTEYSLIDANGNVVPASGWVAPGTSGAAIVFDNLDPNTTYTVVARPVTGTQTPQDQQPNGSVIATNAGSNTTAATQEYTLTLVNGAKATEHKRNGAVVAIPDEHSVRFRAGDLIKIDADIPSGKTFKEWNTLLGSTSGIYPTQLAQRITMGAGSATISATYNGSILPHTSNNEDLASLDYSPKDGRFALDPDNDATLLADLINNPWDRGALTGTAPSLSTTPLPVKYTVKFNRSAVAESVQSAIRHDVGDTTNSMKFPWSMKVGIAREVNGINKTATSNNATIKVRAHLEQSLLGNTDYKLYKYDSSMSSYVDVATNPSDLSAASFGGDFEFDAAVGDVFVLSYKKAQKVIVKSEKDGTVNETLHVANGGVMTDDANYVSIRGALATYTDPHTGEEFLFDHFAKGSATGAAFADSDPVTRDLTVFAVYAPDPDWHNAKTNLTNEINRGNGLIGNANLTPTERADLINQINQAVGVNNKLNPGPTTLELSNEHIDLQTLIDSIIARLNGTTPAPTPGGGTSGGGGSHGGGGGGGGRGGRGGSSRGVTGSTTSTGTGNRVYQNGVEGNWVNFDVENHGWYFDLGNGKRIKGTWADVAYTYDGQTKIYSYHFDENGVMDSGWWKNDQGTWFHLSTIHDGWFGSMDKGWYHDSADGRWYYLNLLTGAMMTGWQQIDGTWYYLNPVTPAPTWDWDASQNRWVYGNRPGRPYGSMYANEVTPDGYHVDASGAWIRETP